MPDTNPSQPCSDLLIPINEKDHALGLRDAPVTLVEYGDYECPDCFNALPIVDRLRAHYGDRLRIIFRHFPMSSMHPGASAAAAAAEAAAAQGLFWQMHVALFRRQKDLANVDLTHLALMTNIEVYRFERDRESESFVQRVRDDLDGAIRSGVKGTPTFFINGCRYTGKAEFDAMLAAIDAQLR